MEEIFGYVESVLFADEEGGFAVARLKEPKKLELTCIVGVIPGLRPGEALRCRGSWAHHAQYGLQFKVEEFDSELPTDLLGIQKYLESGMIKGIGPSFAKKIVHHFGSDTLKIIDESPERLTEVAGIGPKRVERVEKCWKEQHGIRNVMIFLRGHGVSPTFALKIFKVYGDKSIQKVAENPYALAKEVHGIGFKSADKIARNLGMDSAHPRRIEAGLEHILWDETSEGHVCLPRELLIRKGEEILEISKEVLEERFSALIAKEQLVEERGSVWTRPLYFSEVGIVKELQRIIAAESLLRSVDAPRAVIWAEEQLSISFAEGQKSAILLAVQAKCLIITGGPGTGKSTITRAILRISEKLTKRIVLAAPTGRAAKRLAEITRRHAQTIHSLLEMDFGTGHFKRNQDNPLKGDLFIIDEASMIDTLLMYHLLKAIPSSARLLFIGDIDQLPSVGPGNVLRDLIASERLPVCRLTEIFRQAKGSEIIVNAHKINRGEFPFLQSHPHSDFLFIEESAPEIMLQKIIALVTEDLPKTRGFHPLFDIQVLTPMKRGVIGAENLNLALQNALNPSSAPLMRIGRRFHLNDKVMQIRNNYQREVFNGDVGSISDIDWGEAHLKVNFDGKEVVYDFDELDELILAYAVSIHKYQGSEAPCVVLPLHLSHFKLLSRNLLYTAITRGKRLVVLIGSKRAIGIAVKNQEVHLRFTGLKEQMEKMSNGWNSQASLFQGSGAQVHAEDLQPAPSPGSPLP